VGHAVRAMYLYCAMANLYSETGDSLLLKAIKRLWLKIVKAKMYITGSIGSIKGIEGFEKDFKLKNEKSYSETCATIGNLMWNWRLLQITGHSKYADLIEKLLYNALLAGYSIDGRKYFYTNPLVSNGKKERDEWFLCACCPPNVARTIASIGKYIYSISEKGLWVHQYIGNKAEIIFNNKILELELESKFPWKGDVKVKLRLKNDFKFSIFLRIPKWCDFSFLLVNGEKYHWKLNSGRYLEIIRNWKNDDLIELEFKLNAKILEGDPRIKENKQKGVISYGPLIYCLEEKDNDFDIFKAIIPRKTKLKVIYKPDLLNGINIIKGNLINGEEFIAIPYYAWNNRGPTKMQVWNKIS
jgi:DUF1680 family protein